METPIPSWGEFNHPIAIETVVADTNSTYVEREIVRYKGNLAVVSARIGSDNYALLTNEGISGAEKCSLVSVGMRPLVSPEHFDALSAMFEQKNYSLVRFLMEHYSPMLKDQSS